MKKVKAKKQLGQHFLVDEGIAKNIVNSLQLCRSYDNVIEVGPGMGVLTQFLIQNESFTTYPIDIDRESIGYLTEHFPALKGNIIYGDFLSMNLNEIIHNKPFSIIGNFPYNISTQILFKALEYREQVVEIVGMFQKEVAERVVSQPGSKVYGITSVLLQAFYDVEYLFTVNEEVFDPPPKVKSAVIRLTRNNKRNLECDEKLFKQVVKMGFNQRRKTLRNSLRSMLTDASKTHEMLSLRPEQLSVEDFIALTNVISSQKS